MTTIVKIIILNAGPIYTLAAEGLLDILLVPKNSELVVIQCVLNEILVRAPEVQEFLIKNSTRIKIISTSVCKDDADKILRGEQIGKGRGDLAIADFILNHMDESIGNAPALAIFVLKEGVIKNWNADHEETLTLYSQGKISFSEAKADLACDTREVIKLLGQRGLKLPHVSLVLAKKMATEALAICNESNEGWRFAMSTPTPPTDFQSWLDYAVATMDARGAYLDRIFNEGDIPFQDDIRAAAQDELDHLRQKAAMPWISMLENWQIPLSKRLGRSAKEIVENNLLATDFPNDSVYVEFKDGTELTFRHAFYVGETPADGAIHRVAVFTENCGFHEFWIGPGDRISASLSRAD